MKFKFTLEKVLKHRQIQIDLARKDFIEAEGRLQQAIFLRDEMIRIKEENLAQRSQLVRGQQFWQNQVEQINQFVKGQDLRIARQNESLNQLKKEVESYREILLKALTEAKMIEKLKEKKKEQFYKKAAEIENKELDEIATLRHARIEKE